MAIKFFNVRSGETRVLDPATMDPQFIEPAISALFNSSNLHVNATRGQDFGWRIAPETIKRIQEVKQDDLLINRIAQQTQMLPENITDTDILTWIVKDDARREALKNQAAEQNFEEQYEQELRDMKAGNVSEPGIPADSPADQIPSQPQAAAPQAEAETLDELEAQAAAAAKRNEPTEADRKKAEEEEAQLLKEIEEEEAAEKAKADELAAAGSEVTNAPEKQKAAEANKTPEKTVAKAQAKSDNKSNS